MKIKRKNITFTRPKRKDVSSEGAAIIRDTEERYAGEASYVFFRPDTSILRAVALKSPAGLVSFG